MDIGQNLGSWLIVETGSNQEFVFGTTKQRVQLAASAVTREVGTVWVREALRQESDDDYDPVVLVSGRAEVLVRDNELGRRIIQRVTRRAIESQTGLDVWGVVRTVEPGETLAQSLRRTWRLHAAARAGRTPPSVRFPSSPFVARCAFTGGPAAGLVSQPGDGHAQAVSTSVAVLWDRAPRDRDTLRDRMREAIAAGGGTATQDGAVERALMSAERLEEGQDLKHNGWYGVLHADGNGVGRLFEHLGEGYPEDAAFREALRTVAAELDAAAWQALARAILATTESAGAKATDWVLPILVGGDDIVVVVGGQYAFDFARTLAAEFGGLVQGAPRAALDAIYHQRPELFEQPAGLHRGLSLGCGLVFVKPHYPFSHAIELAEELASNAKRLTRRCSAIDVHVLFDSGVRTVAQVRAELDHREDLVAARAELSHQEEHPDDNSYSPLLGAFVLDGDPSEVPSRPHLAAVGRLMDVIEEAAITPGLVHQLREALGRPSADGPEHPSAQRAADRRPDVVQYEVGVERALQQVRFQLGRRGIDLPVEVADDLHLEDGVFSVARFMEWKVSPAGLPQRVQARRTALLTVLDLVDVGRGTRVARQRHVTTEEVA